MKGSLRDTRAQSVFSPSTAQKAQQLATDLIRYAQTYYNKNIKSIETKAAAKKDSIEAIKNAISIAAEAKNPIEGYRGLMQNLKYQKEQAITLHQSRIKEDTSTSVVNYLASWLPGYSGSSSGFQKSIERLITELENQENYKIGIGGKDLSSFSLSNS